jgi:hypothetical protein
MSTVSQPNFGLRTALAVAFAAFAALAAGACTSDPGYPAGSPPEGSGVLPGTDTGSGSGCGVAQVAEIFANNCISCHGSTGAPDGLNLTASGLTARLNGKPSVGCSGKVLVSPGNAAGSYLLDKLQGDATCGVQMPKGKPALDATSINCVADWIDALAPASSGGGTGGDVPPPGTGGGGGW